jgi:hypothetical protein
MAITRRLVTKEEVGLGLGVKNALLNLMDEDKGVTMGYVTPFAGEDNQSFRLEVHGKTTADKIVEKLMKQQNVMWFDSYEAADEAAKNK